MYTLTLILLIAALVCCILTAIPRIGKPPLWWAVLFTILALLLPRLLGAVVVTGGPVR